MSTPPRSKPSSRGLILVTFGVLAIFVVLFVIAFITGSNPPPPEETLTADSYMAEVEPLLANADAARGEALVQQYECHSCHIEGASRIAPPFAGMGERAKTERPPLKPEAYLYEAIINPRAHLSLKPLESDAAADATPQPYPPAMPIDYATRLPKQDLGDIIAYLLTQ